MSTALRRYLSVIVVATGVAGCGGVAMLPVSAGMGANPALPEPQRSLIPVLNIAPAQGWSNGAKPVTAPGTVVSRFADGLDHPRWLYLLPNGDVLVAETNAPPKPEDGKGIKGWVMKKVMSKAGAGSPSANRISLLRDTNGDGVADTKSVFVEGLNSPFGMALVGSDFYVAATDAVLRFPYAAGDMKITVAGTKVMDLPGGPLNHHWTKNLIAGPDGAHLYVTVGSNSNVAENGFDQEEGRAAIWELDLKTGSKRIFASGLRNPNGMAWQTGGVLWTAVNERDESGSDLVPDYMTSVKDGGFYGWPYSYYGTHVDTRVKPPRQDLVATAISPDYALGPHTGSLGLASSAGTSLPAQFGQGMFVGQHGSWNRKPHSGYKVIFVPFANGKPATNAAVDVLTGFVTEEGNAQGRPVGVALDKTGALLVADDVGNTIWRVSAAAP